MIPVFDYGSGPILFVLGLALVYGAGIATGWHLARRATGYMLDGRR